MSPQKPSSNTTTILVVVALVAIVLVAIGYYLSSNKPAGDKSDKANLTNQEQAAANGNEQPNPNQPPAPVVPSEVYSYVGEVTAVAGDTITVSAKPNVNYLKVETALKVKADDNTQIISRTIPKVLPKEGGANLFKQENIKLSDIKTGDQVTVVSAANIKDQTEFTASRIEVLNIK